MTSPPEPVDPRGPTPDFVPPRSWTFKFACALRGWSLVVRGETSAVVHAVGAAAAVVLAMWLQVDTIRWAIVVAAIGVVFACELLNTAIETLARKIERRYDHQIRDALDLAAGGVLAAAATAVVLGLLALGPPLWERLFVK